MHPCGVSTLLSLYWRHEGSDMRVRVTVLPRDPSTPLFLTALSCWTIKLFICQRRNATYTTMPLANKHHKAPACSGKIQIALWCFAAPKPVLPVGRDKVWSRVFTQRQLTDALNRAVLLHRVEGCNLPAPLYPSVGRQSEAERGTVNHKSLPDL